MTTDNKLDLPIVAQFGIKELEETALRMALAEAGIKDTVKFCDENVIEYRVNFKTSAGVAVAITSIRIKPKKPVKQSPAVVAPPGEG